MPASAEDVKSQQLEDVFKGAKNAYDAMPIFSCHLSLSLEPEQQQLKVSMACTMQCLLKGQQYLPSQAVDDQL